MIWIVSVTSSTGSEIDCPHCGAPCGALSRAYAVLVDCSPRNAHSVTPFTPTMRAPQSA